MERFRLLVQELNRQLQGEVSPEQLRQTIALLNLELERAFDSPNRNLGTAKVAVVLPVTPIPISTDSTHNSFLETDSSNPAEVEKRATEPKPKPKPKSAPLVLFDEEFQVEPLEPIQPVSAPAAFDVMEEVPTLYMHRGIELNEQLLAEVPSLNDQLKSPSVDRLDTLREGPVTDLRKAIGVNERFQFVRELFRNDEAMYERSIKTINQFQIFPEADFWINRELKTKLGWPIDHPLVRQFDQLVRRRFS